MNIPTELLVQLVDDVRTYIEQREAEQIAHGIHDVTMTGAKVIDGFRPITVDLSFYSAHQMYMREALQHLSGRLNILRLDDTADLPFKEWVFRSRIAEMVRLIALVRQRIVFQLNQHASHRLSTSKRLVADVTLTIMSRLVPRRDQQSRQLLEQVTITLADHYDLLEFTEVFAADIPNLADVLALEYQAITLEELNLSLRQGRPMPAYISDVRRVLHCLNQKLADELSQEIEIRHQEIAEHSLSVPYRVIGIPDTTSLAGIRLTLVSGHVVNRREVERELRECYGITNYCEIASSIDDHVDKTKVRDLIVGRDLVIILTGYISHNLTNIIRDLQRSQDSAAHVIWRRCRGKSGVVREIVTTCLSL